MCPLMTFSLDQWLSDLRTKTRTIMFLKERRLRMKYIDWWFSKISPGISLVLSLMNIHFTVNNQRKSKWNNNEWSLNFSSKGYACTPCHTPWFHWSNDETWNEDCPIYSCILSLHTYCHLIRSFHYISYIGRLFNPVIYEDKNNQVS
jgi:hypothetical protein